MIYYKTEEQIELIRENCLLVCKTLALVGSMLKPGITGTEIDQAAEEFIRDHGAEPGFKGYGGFPSTLCVSPNEAVVHGFPEHYEFKDNDVVSVDCGVLNNGYYGDAAFTFALGDVSDDIMKLLQVTHDSLYLGIEQAKIGNRLGDIGHAIQHYAEKEHGYGVVRDLVGHGIGQNLHEAPQVPNYGKRGRGTLIKEGLVIAIEPMVNLGNKAVVQKEDGWTIVSKDNTPSAHYEHTIAVTKNGPQILSNHSFIYDEIKNNKNIKVISEKK